MRPKWVFYFYYSFFWWNYWHSIDAIAQVCPVTVHGAPAISIGCDNFVICFCIANNNEIQMVSQTIPNHNDKNVEQSKITSNDRTISLVFTCNCICICIVFYFSCWSYWSIANRIVSILLMKMHCNHLIILAIVCQMFDIMFIFLTVSINFIN